MTVVNHNGSKWAGDPPDSLGKLLDMLASHPLDATFEDYGNFYSLAHGCIDGGRDEKTGERIYHDTGPIYPENPHTVRFFGNFLTYSHGFSIDTDDAEVIEVLHAAIAANKQRPDYLAQKVAA